VGVAVAVIVAVIVAVMAVAGAQRHTLKECMKAQANH